MMQKTAILAAESMLLDQKDTKAAKKVAKTMTAEAYSITENIKRLESDLVALKRFNISTRTSLQLDTARQEIVDLKTRLDANQVKYECVVSKLRSTAYAKDEELIVAYNQVINFKKIIDRLEPQVLELHGALEINESLKKEVDEQQRVRVGLLEMNKQLKSVKVGLEASLVQSQADFYKLGYVDHLFVKPSDFDFAGKDFETFSISLEDLLAITFEAFIGEVVRKVGAQARAVGGEALDDAVAESVMAA